MRYKLHTSNQVAPMDNLTACIETAMNKLVEVNKPISAEDANDICM